MAPIYPDHVREAARVLYRRDVGTKRTREMLMNGTAGLKEKYEPGISTIEKWRAAFRAEGEQKGFAVGPDQITEVEEAIYCDFLACGKNAVKRLKEAEAKGTADAAMVARVRGYIVAIDGHRTRKPGKDAGLPPDAGAATVAAPVNQLHKITAERKRREAEAEAGNDLPQEPEGEGLGGVESSEGQGSEPERADDAEIVGVS